MVVIKEVNNKKEQKNFLIFPLKLYKNNPYYVPLLRMDEKRIFSKKYVYNDTCDVIFFNAYKDGKMAGRISGIIQRVANQKWNQNRIRFTRFDSIDDQEVANALFDAVKEFGLKNNIDEMVGPLGYSDFEREGLLIEGFDQMNTYEEQYNYDYYQKLIENYGFEKDVDWIEWKIYLDQDIDERYVKISNMMLKKYNLKLWQPKSIGSLLKNYGDQFFDIIDETYKDIYGSVPMDKRMRESAITSFKLIVRSQDVALISDENDRLVAFGISFPSISDAVRKSKGRITLPFLFRFLKIKKNPKVLDLGLIGVLPEYARKGIVTAIYANLFPNFKKLNLDHIETNLMLENNFSIQNLSGVFRHEQNKRRRCYIKKIRD